MKGIILEVFLFGCIFMMGIYHIGVFFLRRKDSSPLYFGLSCLAVAIRIFTVGENYLTSLFPQMEWSFFVTLHYLCTYFLLVFFSLFLYSLYSQFWKKRVLQAILAFLFGLILTVLFAPAYIFTSTMPLFQATTIVVILYFAYVVFLAILKKKDESLALMIGLVIFFLATIHDILLSMYPQFLFQIQILPIGLFLSIFFQAFLLAQRFSGAFSAVENLSEKLIGKIKLEEQNRALLKIDHLRDEFLANTSHELRTPLHGIMGLASALIDDSKEKFSPQSLENLDLIVKSAQRLSHQVNDLIDFSQLKHAGEGFDSLHLHLRSIELHSLVDLVLKISTPLLGQKDIELLEQIPKSLAPVLADENRLQQILTNLIGNAIKFTHQGRIVVQAKQVDENFIQIIVQDTGIGISEKNQKRIFEAFEQADGSTVREYGGTGLGLSITKKLVELHSGKIFVHSQEGEGSSFAFSLPINKGKAFTPDLTQGDDLANESQSLKENQFLRKEKIFTEGEFSQEEGISTENDDALVTTILVVDDEPVNLQVLKSQLEPQGLRVLMAQDGFQALEILDIEREKGRQPDLMLLDLMMPRMNGFEVIRKVRQKEKTQQTSFPILLLTAKNTEETLIEAFEAGANDYLPKPFSKQVLLARTSMHLRLANFNRELEKKVEERTDELQKKHRQLLETQTQLVQSEKMSSLGILVAGVAHDINNPTGGLILSSHNLNQKLVEFKDFLFSLVPDETKESKEILTIFDERFQSCFEIIELMEEGGKRIRDITENLRIFSRMDDTGQNLQEGEEGTNSPKKTRVIEGLISTLKLVQVQFRDWVDFKTDLQADPEIDCTPSTLNQVFMNIIVNACQAMQNRGKGVLTISSFLLFNEKTQKQQLAICFQDTGCGMSEEVQHKMFDPFFTTKPEGEGTGLGLSIAHGIMKKHQGSYKVNSELGKGTSITLLFPIHE